MKYLIIVLCLFGCTSKNLHKDPLFKLGQNVTFVPPTFYMLVCSGAGTVADYQEVNGSYSYTVKTPGNETNCPLSLVVEETDLKTK